MIQWSDKVPDGFFTLEDVTVGSTNYLYVHTGDYDYSVNPKQNWRGHCYSQKNSSSGDNTTWTQLKKNSNGDILTGGGCSSSSANVAQQYVWFEYQPLKSAASYTCGTIAKKSIIPANYNDNAEFIFEYNGKTAKVINSRKFKIISSLEVMDNGDIQFTLFHTGETKHQIKRNVDGSYSYDDIFMTDDTRRYDDLTSILYFYLPTENGMEILEMANVYNEFYVKVNGKGSGRSWEDAMGPLDYLNRIKNCPNGSTFHFAAGVYDRDEIQNNGGEFSAITKNVAIIGGYPEQPQENAETDVKNNKTVFKGSGDFFFVPFSGGDIEIEFQGLIFENSCFNMHSGRGNDGYIKSIRIDSCVFKGSDQWVAYYADMIIIKNSYYDRDESKNLLDLHANEEVYVYASSFVGKGFSYANIPFSIKSKNCEFINNTVVLENRNAISINSEETGYVYNNTLVWNSTNLSSKTPILVGENLEVASNLLVSNSENLISGENNIFKNNVFSNGIIDNSSDYFVSDSEWTKILDIEYDEESSTFIPNLAVKVGGFVPTISINTDVLPNGTIIRFDRLNNAYIDANGLSRNEGTCPGAVEYERKDYYVKETGKGYGTSWTDAMGPEDFVKKLQNCPEGSNFYIAKGKYDIFEISKSLGNTSGYIDLNGGVNLYGGYSDKASKTSDRRDPKNNITKLGSAANKGCIRHIGQSDNMTLNSIQFENVGVDLEYIENDFNIDSCYFDGFPSYTFKWLSAGNLNLTNSYFGGGISGPIVTDQRNVGNATIKNCTFADFSYNSGGIGFFYISAQNDIYFVNNTFSNLEYGKFASKSSEGKIYLYNNTFVGKMQASELIGDVVAVGNIYESMFGNSTEKWADAKDNVLINVSGSMSNYMPASQKELDKDDLDKLFEGEYVEDATRGKIFVPTLTVKEGGYVPTVTLKTDILPSKKSIRFDRLTNVRTDANGVTRETNTCAGAVEYKTIRPHFNRFNYTVNNIECPTSLGSVDFDYGTNQFAQEYDFFVELTSGTKKYQSDLVLTTEYTKKFTIKDLPVGDYSLSLYFITPNGNVKGDLSGYSSTAPSTFTIKLIESTIPTPTMGSRNYTVTNKCTEPNGGIDCSVYKWTDDVFTVQVYSVDEDENETLVLDDVQPDRIDEYNDVKTAIFMIHKLAGGTYKFKVSDACGVVIDYNFTVRDEIQPDPVLTYEVTPYSCKKSDSKEDAKDGSITINVENYGYNSTLSKVVGEDSEILSYTTRESDGSVIFNLTELGTSDNFTLKLQNTCFTEDKEFEINMKEEAQKNGLFYLKSAEVKANAECTADNRRINFVVKGGQPSYSYQVIDKNTGNVAYTLDAYSASNTTSILPEGEYKFVASDANGCTDEISEGLDITTKHTLTAKKQAVCGDYIHVDLDYTGSLLSAGVHLTSYKSNSTTKKVTFDENSGDKYFFYEGDCDWMTGTFSSDYCQGFALLEEEEEKPLNIGYGRLPEIVPVSCLNSEGGSYTYYPRSQMSLRGYKLVLVATNKTSGKSYKSNEANNAGTALSVNELPAGEYEAYLALTYEDCIVESSKMTLDDFTIETIADPSLDVESIKLYPPYCHATQNGDFSINIKNWNSECKAYLFYDNEQVWSADHIGYEVGSYGISGSLMKGLSATESEVNGLEVISDVTVAVSSMFGGTFTVGLQDQCGNRTTKEFELNSIEKPAFNVVSAYTDLSCSDSKDGSMSVALYGGRPEYARVYVNNVKQDVTEDSRTIRLSGLEPGSYTFKYESISRYCADNATFTVDVMVPDPMDITVVPEDVVCPADGASVNFTITGGTGDKNITLLDAEGEEVATATAEYSSDNKNAVAAVSGLMPGQVYSAKVEDANGCPTEAKDIEVNYKNQGDLTGIDAEVTSAGQTCINRENGALNIKYSGNTDEKELIFTAVDAKGGRHNASVNDAEGMTTIDYLAKGEYTIYVDYNNGDCSVASPFAKKVATATIKDASTTSIKVEEIKCSGKVFSTVYFGNVESVLLYDAEDNVTAPSIIRGIISSTEEGSFERAYLTLINGCEQNATLEKTDETDNLVATFKELTVKYREKTEQSACDETTINDGSLTITLESSLDDPAYAYSIILKDAKGKVAGQIDDITDFSQSFEFRELAPGTYNGFLAVKVGDCLLESENKFFTEEISLNKETVAVERLAYGKPVEDVCKGTATLPFTVTGAIEGATVKVMKGEEEIESIAIAEDGDYSTSSLEVGKYTLVYTATNEKGCIEKDEEPFGITTPTLNLPLYRSLVNASNANCMDNGKIVIEYGFYTRNSANDYECAIYPFYAKVTDVNSPEKEYKSDVQPASSDGKQWVNTKGTITFDNLPAGKYDVQFYYVTEGCDVMATFPASDVECREYDRFGGHAQQIPYSSIVNNTIPINIYAPDLSNLDVQLKDLNVVNPMCGNTTEVGVSVDYSGFDTKVAKLRLSAVEKSEVEEKQSFEVFADANEGTLALTEMPEGTYDVKVQLLGFDGCEFEDGVKLEQEVTIKALNNPSLVESSLKSTSPDCYKSPNGEASVTITNWNEKCVAYIYEGEEVVWSAKAIGEGTANGVTGLLQKSSDAVESTENGLKTISGVVVSASALSGGNYSFVLVDQCGEKQSVDFPLNYFNEPFFIVQSAHTNLDCASSKDGKVSVSLSSGSPEHTEIYVDDVLYENNSISLTGLGEGTYNFKYVNSSENCPDEVNFPVAVTAPDPIDFTFTAEDVTCAEDGASVTFKVENANGTPTVTLYDSDKKAVSSGMTIVGLKPSVTYSAKVEDENGCTAEIEEVKVTYKEQPSLEGIAATVTAYDQSSVCENNGRLGIVFEGNSAESDLRFYTVDANGDTHAVTSSAASGNLSIRKLAAGDYTVYVDYNNDECSSASPYATEVDKATIEGIGQIAIDASSLVSVDPTCVSPANGQIDIDILNWGSGSTVTVYRNEMPLWATTEAYDKEYTSGAPCWFYYADADKKSAHVAHLRIPNVSGGSYKVEVDNGCDYVKDYTIELASLSKPELSLREDDCQLAIKCAGQETGVIAFNVGGGNASNLKAYINEEEITPDKAGKCVKEGLAAGSYALSYKSTVEGCKDAASLKEPVEITVPEKLTATYNADNVVCAEKGAKVTFKVEGGTGTPTVTLYNEEGKAVSTGMTIVGLKPDVVYSAKVEDANGCSTEVKDIKVNYVEMPNLEEVTAEIFAYDESCHEGKNGRIVATFSGVTALNNVLFTIIGEDNVRRVGTINNAGTAAVFEELAPGEYTVYVDYDNGECSSSSPVAKALGTTKIVEMGQIAIDESSFVPTVATCTEPANGRVDIDILNWGRESGITVYRGDSPIWGTQVASLGEYSGSAPCQFYYEDKEKQEAHTAHLKIENINGGTYKVEVDNGCGYKTDYTITLDELAKPSITFNEDDSHLHLDCDYSKDGVLAFSVEGGNASTFGVFVSKQNESGEFTDEIEVAADENGNYVATDLLANNYMATFKSKEEGCKDEASLKEAVEITAPEAVSMHLSYGKVECEATGAKATVEAGGGTPGYTYSWTNSEGTLLGEKEEITGLSEGKDYQVVVKDSKKCLVSQKFNIDPLVKTPLTSIKVSNWDHKDQTCYNINNGSISFSFSGNSAASSLQFAVFGEDGQPVAGKSITSNAEKDDVTIDELAPGIYDVKLAYSYKGCEADDKSISVVEAINIEGLEKPMFIDKNYTITPNKCENASEGRMHFEMMGWKDGIYTWTLQRAGQSKDDLTENTHHGELLENGAIAFDLWGLPEGENIFTMWDGCENGFRYSKSDVVKDAHEDKPELEVVDKIAFSCLDRKDGGFTFVASPWDVANTARFKKDEEEAKDVHPSLKDGKAYFEYKEQGAGTYTLSVKDLCKRDVILPFDFTEFSSKNGALVAAVDFDADAAKCDVDARQFTVTANGGTAPYVYAITKVDGTAVKTSEATEETTFASDLLTDGSYKVSVTDKTDCKAIYNGDIIIDPAHVMEAKMREAVCGDKKTVLIVASIDKGTIAGNKFVAYDAEGKSYPAGMALGSMSFYSIPVDVKLKGLSAVVGAECSVYAETVELPLDESALETANVTVASHHNQQCYKVDNGEITLNYEGPEMSYDVMMFLKYTVDGEVKYIESEPQHGTKLQFAFEKLAPGEYELYLTHVVGKCDAGVEPRKIQDVTIKELKEPLELFKEKTRVIQSTCYSEMNAQAIIAVTGWVPDTYKETFYKYKEDGSLEYLWSEMNANDISDEEHKVHAWATEKNLTAGKYHTTWGDICTPEKVVYDFTVEPLNKPKLEILSSSYTDLKCSYDKAYIDFKYEGGAPDNKRLLFKFQPKGKGYDDWNWTTEELKSENTYRYYGHAMGDGNQGHDKAEGTTYELTDEDKGLADGSYVIIYQDSTGACPKDEVSGSIVVKRNEPINIFTYSRNVVCQDKAQGSLAFVFNRLKIENNDTTIATGPSYTNENFPNKYTGTNWANLMFLPEAQQSELYHRGYNAVFGSLNNKDLLKLLMSWGINNPYLLVYYTQYIRDNYPYSSNMFSDVNKIEIISRNKSHEQLYSELAKAVEDSTMKYPLKEMYLHGKDYQVPTEWMGFKSLYPDFYNIVITDDLGCRYVSDTIEITVPSYKKPLTIDEVVFDAEAGYCDADKRRITFRASGGWGDYHYSAVNLDSADIDKSLEELPDDDETEYGKLLDKNYVADGHVEAFGQKGTSEYYEIYTTPIQKPGRIKISVVDSLGCTTTGGVYELTAKYLLSGLTQNDWCSPDENNNYYPVVLNGSDAKPSSTSVDSFKVRIGHRTVREDSVEYRKVLPNELLTYDKNADEEDAKYYGKRYIEKVPGGQVGYFAYMPDGCSAFNEEEFLTSDNFRKLTLTAEGNLAANCYLEPSGALQFSIYGGNDSYDKLYLDGRDLMTNAEIESIQKHSVTSKPIIENGEKVGVSVDTVHLSSFSFYEFATEDEFNTLNEKFNVEAGSTQDIKINYYFTLQNLVGNTNLIPPFEAKDTSHILIVQDAKGCRDTLDFKVDQPEKLQITAAGSVMCADGSGRIFVDQVSGGVGDYLYSLDDKESFDDNTHKPIVFGSKGHVLYVQDANNCVSEPSNTVSTGEAITWDDVEQDVMISTWHDYGNVLVVIDKTNYHALKYVSGENKGKPFEYHYDSIKVEIIRSEDFPVEVVGVVQPKEYYTYGIKGPSFDNVEGGETDVDTTGMHIDASGSVYKYVSWLQKNVYGPTWGVPEEVIASIKPDDQVQFLDKQYSIEKGALDDSVRNVVDKLCRNCGYLDKLRSMNRLSSQLYKSEADELKIEQLRSETDAIFAKYHQIAEASLNYDVKVEAMKQKYGFGYGTLSGIRSTFDKLVPDSAAERMTFIKFEENRTTGTNGTPAESVLEKYFSSNNDSETLSFGIRTTTYVSGCDITEEYNSLVLNLKGDNPYPNPDFKNTIRLECSPSVLTYPTEQLTELIVHMSKEEPFTYQVFGIDGKVLKTKTNNSSSPKTETNEDGETEYVFHIQLTGITQTCVVKVTTESNSAATKILVK